MLGWKVRGSSSTPRSIGSRNAERMMDADTIAVDVKGAETALAALHKELDVLKKEFGEELSIAEASIAKASEARAELATALAPATLALFEQVAKARKGVALCGATRDGLCSVCHVRLRPQVFQKVRANDSLIQCDSCQRIMYYVPPPPPIEHPVVHTS